MARTPDEIAEEILAGKMYGDTTPKHQHGRPPKTKSAGSDPSSNWYGKTTPSKQTVTRKVSPASIR